MPRLTLTMTAMARPALFRQTLVSLLKCGIDDWHLFVGVEPSPQQTGFAEICQALLPAARYTIALNPTLLGVRDNPYATISRAFAAGSDFNLGLEEDLLLAPDALDLAQWYLRNHRPHWAALNLLAGACGSEGNLSHPAHPALLFESRCFNSYGVGFTRSDWERAAPHWRRPGAAPRGGWVDLPYHWGWDWALYGWILRNPDLRVLQPVAARCTHTGAEGKHSRKGFHQRAFGRLEIAAGRPEGASFALADFETLPAETAAHARAQNEAGIYLANLVENARPRHSTRLGAWLSATNRRLRGR